MNDGNLDEKRRETNGMHLFFVVRPIKSATLDMPRTTLAGRIYRVVEIATTKEFSASTNKRKLFSFSAAFARRQIRTTLLIEQDTPVEFFLRA
jgi:hypothetical protein